MEIDENGVAIWFVWNRPYLEIEMIPTTIHFLLVNLTRTSMYYTYLPFDTSYSNIDIRNTNDWKEGDNIKLYVAISGDFWFGNFNLQQL